MSKEIRSRVGYRESKDLVLQLMHQNPLHFPKYEIIQFTPKKHKADAPARLVARRCSYENR